MEFKHQKKRILIIGTGDIGKRLINQKLQKKFHSNLKFYSISRSIFPLNFYKKINTQNKVNFFHKSLNIDEFGSLNKIIKIASHVIILTPTKSHNDVNKKEFDFDPRAKKLSTAVKRKAIKPKGVYISTTGVYGNAKGQLIDETFKCRPKNKRSIRRLKAEIELRKNLNFHILRVPGIYAHNRLPIDRIKSLRPILNEREDIYTNHIHADDLARISFIALFLGKASRITNVVDESNLKMGEYFKLVAKKFDLSIPPRVSLSEIKRKVEEKEITEMMASFFYESRRIKNSRLKKELKFKFKFPTVESTLKKIN